MPQTLSELNTLRPGRWIIHFPQVCSRECTYTGARVRTERGYGSTGIVRVWLGFAGMPFCRRTMGTAAPAETSGTVTFT